MKLTALWVVASLAVVQGSRVHSDGSSFEGERAGAAAARELRKIGAAEHAVMKELHGHPQLQGEERHYLEEAADLVLRASQMQQNHHHHPHVTALLHEGSHAATHRTEAKAASSMEAENHAMMQKYGSQMFQLAKKNLHLAKEIAQAKIAVAKELHSAGMSSANVKKIEEELSKAKLMEQHIIHSETNEAKQMLHKAKAYGLAQTHAGHHAAAKMSSVAALKVQNRLHLRKYGLGMSKLVRSNRHLARELAHAKDEVLKALNHDGAPKHLMDEVSKELNQAKKMQRKVTVMEEHEAKSALRESKAAGLVQESSGTSAMTVSKLKAHEQMVVRKYAKHMSHLARQNRRLGDEIAFANRAIAKALKRDGASAKMRHEVAAELRKAKVVELKLAKNEEHVAKTMLRKRKVASLAQSESKATMKSMEALKVEGQMARQQYREGMAHLAEDDKATVHEVSQARDEVAEALEKAGATAEMENNVDALLGKVELAGRRLMTQEKREAKA